MNVWYYSRADEVVGPFQLEALGKLRHAGVIDDGTMVHNAEAGEWQPLAAALATDAARVATRPEEARYYYLDAKDQPVGPFDLATMRCLHTERVLSAGTLVSAVGDVEWTPAARLLKLPSTPALAPIYTVPAATAETSDGIYPRHLSFERFVFLTVVTGGLYPFYLVPCQSRDLKAVTGRGRMEFSALLLLGIVTLGLLLLIMQVLYAFDLERHGNATRQTGRQGSLGLLVLVLTVLSGVLPFVIDYGLLSYLAGVVPGSAALWLVQQEINLYAAAPNAAESTIA